MESFHMAKTYYTDVKLLWLPCNFQPAVKRHAFKLKEPYITTHFMFSLPSILLLLAYVTNMFKSGVSTECVNQEYFTY